MKPKPITALVPKARKCADAFLAAPTVANARPLVLMVEHLSKHGVSVDFFTYNRYVDACLTINGAAKEMVV